MSRLNTQLPKYISYKPDPYAYLIDAFSVHWRFYRCFLFPPLSFVGQTLQKIRMDQTEVILVVSKWSTQPWFNTLQGMLSQEPYLVTSHKENLILPQKKKRGTEPLVVETNIANRESLREVILRQGFDNDTVGILMTSWRKGTFSNYCLYMSKSFKFASCNKVSPVEPPVQVALAFLTSLVREVKKPLSKFVWQVVHCHQ